MEESLEKKAKRPLITSIGVLGAAIGLGTGLIVGPNNQSGSIDTKVLMIKSAGHALVSAPMYKYLVAPHLIRKEFSGADCAEYAAAMGAGYAGGCLLHEYAKSFLRLN